VLGTRMRRGGRWQRGDDMSNWRELPAGRELDALVAEKVMGWKYRQSSPDPKKHFCREYGNDAGWWLKPSMTPGAKHWACATCSPPPAYSTDIAAAWEVTEKLAEDFMLVYAVAHAGWRARFEHAEGWWKGEAYADTAPLAICRAALAALEPA
jgi:hypothetical protein